MYVKWVKPAQLGGNANPDILNYYSTDTAPLDPLASYSVQVYVLYVSISLLSFLSGWDTWGGGGGFRLIYQSNDAVAKEWFEWLRLFEYKLIYQQLELTIA